MSSIALLWVLILSSFAFSSCVASADTTSGWGTPVLVEYLETGDEQSSKIAIDPAGNMFAVWNHWDPDSSTNSVMANRYVAGHGWMYPEMISVGYGTTSAPRIATDGSGNAFVAYTQSDGTYYNVMSSVYTPDEGWGAPYLLDDYDASAYYPDIAVDDDGNAVVVWIQNIDTSLSVLANVYTAGVGWGGVDLLESADAESHHPRVAIDSTGIATVVWAQDTSIRIDIWASRYDPGTGWGLATLLETSDDGSADYPRVAMDGSGNALATWQQYDGETFNILASRYEVGEGWGSPEMLDDEPGGAETPVVDMGSHGDAVVVWRQWYGSISNTVANVYVAGSGWGDPELVESNDVGQVVNPTVDMNDDGVAFAIWNQHDGYRYNTWANRYIPGTGWEDATLLENSGGACSAPCILVEGSGNAMALWSQEDLRGYSLYANRYIVPDETPPALVVTSPVSGTETTAPSVTVSGETEPGATLTVNGLVVFVSPDGAFSLELALSNGTNEIVAVATDAAGNPTTVSVTVEYTDPMPALLDELDALEDELLDTQEELNTSLDQLQDLGDELDSVQERLTEAESGTDDDGIWKALSIVGLVAAIIAILMALALARSLSRERDQRRLGPPGKEAPPQEPMRSSVESAPARASEGRAPRTGASGPPSRDERPEAPPEPPGDEPDGAKPMQPTVESAPSDSKKAKKRPRKQ